MMMMMMIIIIIIITNRDHVGMSRTYWRYTAARACEAHCVRHSVPLTEDPLQPRWGLEHHPRSLLPCAALRSRPPHRAPPENIASRVLGALQMRAHGSLCGGLLT